MAGCVAACAGHSSDQGGETGGTSGGGAGAASGLGGFGGVGAVVPEGGLTVTVTKAATTVAQMACPVIKTYLIGAPDAPSMTDPGESLLSGKSGSMITCSVTGQGQFAFSGALHATTTQGEAISINFSNGSIAADGSGSIDIAFYSPELVSTFSGTGCSVAVEDQQVKPGAVWASFRCPQIASPPSGLCGLEGVLVFENCVGSEG